MTNKFTFLLTALLALFAIPDGDNQVRLTP